jgi:PST family polysaccharide transporter
VEINLAASTAFWISCAAGVVLCSLAIFISPWAATFFEEPKIEPMIQFLAISFLITSVGSTHDALLQKELDFKKKTIPDLAQAFFRGVFSILLAWLNWGVWSLIWGQVIGALAFTLAAWVVLPWRPRLVFNKSIAKELIRYGYQIVLTNLLATVGARTDLLLIGKLAGGVALGFYALAFKIPDLMIMSIMTVTSRVIFPAYAKLQHDPQALKRAFLVTLQFISLTTFPIGVGLLALTPDLIYVVYTDKWAPAIPVLQVLAIFAVVRIVGWAGTGSIYKAIGRPDIITKTSLLKTILIIPASWWVIHQYGAIGAAFAQLGVAIFISGVNLFIAHRVLQMKLSVIFGEMRVAFLGALLMFISLEIFLHFISPRPSLTRLIIASVLGGSIYLLTVWLSSRETVLLARKLIGFAPNVSK